MVGQAWLVGAWVQLPGQGEEGLWVSGEVGHIKDGGGLGYVVMLQVVIETSPGSPM